MSEPSESGPEQVQEPANLRFLRRLVTTLMVVMIGGLLVIVALFVMRFSSSSASGPLTLPKTITLPDGVKAQNFTVGPDWYGVVTQDNQILIFDRATGVLRQTVTIQSVTAKD